MKKLAFSHKKPRRNEQFFITNGPQKDKTYLLSFQQPDSEPIHLPTCNSLDECRIAISKYLLGMPNENSDSVFNQLCKKLDRKKDVWDQWKVSQFI